MCNQKPQELSIYIHWPFCKSKCPYCDFNSHKSFAINEDDWKQSYINEINLNKDLIKDKTIKSIFFGGGTPSLMSYRTIDSILKEISHLAHFSNDIEITLEANPNSIERGDFKDFKTAGVNRVSIGIQSFDNNNLKFLGRSHSSNDGLKAIEYAQKVFDNYSFDLMYCLPGQQIHDWEYELEKAVQYIDYHISCYQLTIEKGTQFFNLCKLQSFKMPDETTSIKMYKATIDILQSHGIHQYEISNYSKLNHECKHNMSYWQLNNYIGIGPGAHGRYSLNNRTYYSINYYDPKKWFKYVYNNESPIQSTQLINSQQCTVDKLTMGLRLNMGIRKINIPNLESMNDLIKKGFLIEDESHYIKSTLKGRLVLNTIIEKLLF